MSETPAVITPAIVTPATQPDMLARLRAVLPARWFADDTPVLDALLSGLAATAATLAASIAYLRLQTRIATVTDSFIDAAAADYCAGCVTRRTGEADAALRARLQRELGRERNTIPALVAAVVDVTGRAPDIFEPGRPANAGGYGMALGYGAAGAYGSLTMPFQCLVTAYRPPPGFSVPAVRDSEIFAAIAQVTPVAAVAWTSLRD